MFPDFTDFDKKQFRKNKNRDASLSKMCCEISKRPDMKYRYDEKDADREKCNTLDEAKCTLGCRWKGQPSDPPIQYTSCGGTCGYEADNEPYKSNYSFQDDQPVSQLGIFDDPNEDTLNKIKNLCIDKSKSKESLTSPDFTEKDKKQFTKNMKRNANLSKMCCEISKRPDMKHRYDENINGIKCNTLDEANCNQGCRWKGSFCGGTCSYEDNNEPYKSNYQDDKPMSDLGLFDNKKSLEKIKQLCINKSGNKDNLMFPNFTDFDKKQFVKNMKRDANLSKMCCEISKRPDMKYRYDEKDESRQKCNTLDEANCSKGADGKVKVQILLIQLIIIQNLRLCQQEISQS